MWSRASSSRRTNSTSIWSTQKKTASASNEYNVSHILIALAQDAKPAQLAAAMKLAHEVDDRARNGEDFSKLAVTYSQSETALDGGSLGWRKGTELPTFLADAIARMKPGDVSDVMQTPSGFHIVKLNEMRAAGGPQIVQQMHLRHILLKPTEIEDDATVEQRLARWREQILTGKEEFAGARQDLFAGCRFGDQRRRSGLGGRLDLRAGVRRRSQQAQGGRDQPAVPHPVRLAHRAAAG